MHDFEEILAVERCCFGESWTREMLKAELDNPLTVFVSAKQNGKIAAFAMGRVAADEGELFQIGTLAEFRGRGIASELLESLHAKMREKGAAVCYLEVRSRNSAAVSMYEGAGYEHISVRKNYYPDDDALIMRKILD